MVHSSKASLRPVSHLENLGGDEAAEAVSFKQPGSLRQRDVESALCAVGTHEKGRDSTEATKTVQPRLFSLPRQKQADGIREILTRGYRDLKLELILNWPFSADYFNGA